LGNHEPVYGMRGYQYLYRTTKILDRLNGDMVDYGEYGEAEMYLSLAKMPGSALKNIS
jgi:hypothetical protein